MNQTRQVLIFECLKEWKKITSKKWVLKTVKGEKIDVHNLKKVPLKNRISLKDFHKL